MKKYNFEEDRFYSVSEEDMILDDLLEKAFCDGYEYAQKEFAENSKLRWRAKSDLKITDRIHKHDKNLRNDSIRQYEELLKRDDLSEKERKNIEALAGNLHFLNGDMTEDEYIQKFPTAAKKKYRR